MIVADFQEVPALSLCARRHRPIVHDQQIDPAEPVEQLTVTAGAIAKLWNSSAAFCHLGAIALPESHYCAVIDRYAPGGEVILPIRI